MTPPPAARAISVISEDTDADRGLTRYQLLRAGAAMGVALLVPMPKFSKATGRSSTVLSISGPGAYFRENDILRDEISGELMRVTALTQSTMTVQRGVKWH